MLQNVKASSSLRMDEIFLADLEDFDLVWRMLVADNQSYVLMG